MTSHDPITSRARELYSRASQGVDPHTAQRLRRARQEALHARPASRMAPGLVPVGAFAAAVLALGVAWWLPQHPAAPAPSDASIELASADIEIDGLMAEEDPELYAWLADAPVATRAGGIR